MITPSFSLLSLNTFSLVPTGEVVCLLCKLIQKLIQQSTSQILTLFSISSFCLNINGELGVGGAKYIDRGKVEKIATESDNFQAQIISMLLVNHSLIHPQGFECSSDSTVLSQQCTLWAMMILPYDIMKESCHFQQLMQFLCLRKLMQTAVQL